MPNDMLNDERGPDAPGLSEALMERARKVIPGGVNSPVRAFKGVGGTPRFMASAHGAFLTDVDGRELLDYVGSWGVMVLGHDHPAVRRALADALGRGTSYGAPTEGEVHLAEAIVRLVPGVEVVRMVNSGTEATMSAVRLARAATGRARVGKFRGASHVRCGPKTSATRPSGRPAMMSPLPAPGAGRNGPCYRTCGGGT